MCAELYLCRVQSCQRTRCYVPQFDAFGRVKTRLKQLRIFQDTHEDDENEQLRLVFAVSNYSCQKVENVGKLKLHANRPNMTYPACQPLLPFWFLPAAHTHSICTAGTKICARGRLPVTATTPKHGTN
jgi:hypothetical protein